jgi:Tfp pilus assembly protein PilN
MIRINLLPAEYRRGSRISPKVLGAAFGAALAVAASIGWFGIVYFGELGQLEREDAKVTTELAQKRVRGSYYDKLEANKQDLTTRVQTIQDIGRSRRVWSKFMDELIDVVNNNGDTERHMAWFESLLVKSDAKTKGAMVTLPGAVQGSEMAKVANLHADIEAAPFWRDIAMKSAPGGKLSFDKDRLPPEAFEFQLQLQFRPMVEPPKPAPRRPQTPKKN